MDGGVSSYLQNGGLAILIVVYTVKSFLNNIKEKDVKLEKLTKDNAVEDAIQNEKLKNHDKELSIVLKRLEKIESKIWD